MRAPSVNLQESLVSDKRPTEATEAGSRRRVVEIDKDASPDEAAARTREAMRAGAEVAQP